MLRLQRETNKYVVLHVHHIIADSLLRSIHLKESNPSALIHEIKEIHIYIYMEWLDLSDKKKRSETARRETTHINPWEETSFQSLHSCAPLLSVPQLYFRPRTIEDDSNSTECQIIFVD